MRDLAMESVSMRPLLTTRGAKCKHFVRRLMTARWDKRAATLQQQRRETAPKRRRKDSQLGASIRGTALLTLLTLLATALCASATEHVEAHTSDPSLVWGTYRPQVYVGIRAAVPRSLLSGLVWFSPTQADSFTKARHDAKNDDNIDGYGYTYHDGRSLAVQEIRDVQNNYNIETSWIKTGSGRKAANKAGSWALRVKGSVVDESRQSTLSTVFYASLEGSDRTFEATFDPEDYRDGVAPRHDQSREDDLAHGRFFKGDSPAETLSGFSLRFRDSPGAANSPPGSGQDEGLDADSRKNWHYVGMRAPENALWQGKELVMSDIGGSVQRFLAQNGRDSQPAPFDVQKLSDTMSGLSNVVAVQRTFSGNFSIDIFYDAVDTPKGSLLDGSSLSAALTASKQAHDERLKAALPMKNARDQSFVRDMTSQIVGSIGYYFGQAVVDRSFKADHDDLSGVSSPSDPQVTLPYDLLTATPSRSMFPRGFYWDEGFHLSHIGAWDMDIAVDVLERWLSLIDEDGWVAREQILGAEARSRVPSEFVAQNPSHANPPTLTALFLNDYLTRLEKMKGFSFPLDDGNMAVGAEDSLSRDQTQPQSLNDPMRARKILTGLYPNLRRHYLWFRRTQRGQVKEWGRKSRAPREAYRWRGRTKDHVLTSGLDDYPRAPVPHPGELHLDLISWMGAFAEAMIRVARAVGEDDDAEEYEQSYRGIVANVDALHWDESEQMYCDATVDENDESYHVCHRGYISLFPLFTGLLKPDNPRLGSVLDMLRDPKHLWTDAGLRSLSKQEPLYGQGEDYWRGPVWIPINYYVLRSLKLKYAAEPGPFQAKAAQIYAELRDNVVKNVQKEYERTHFSWEQYNAEDGHGQRSHPFTGWTSMAALILAEVY